MEIQAYFTNIRSQLLKELKGAKGSIYAAVAWFTDQKIFDVLCDKAKAGLDVNIIIMDDDITKIYGLDYSPLEACGGKVYMVSNDTSNNLMHNKFCIIDKITTITGSYNWSIKAQTNHENITVAKENEGLALMFIEEFNRIRFQYFGNEALKKFDIEVISKRLIIIDNLIQLEEFTQIEIHTANLITYALTSEVLLIIELLHVKEYDNASKSIIEYVKRVKSLSRFEEADLNHIKWEIKYLEIEVIALENEKAFLQKIISDFNYKYNSLFGELILEILRLKKEKLHKDGKEKQSEAFRQAEEEFKKYKNEFDNVKKVAHAILNKNDSESLKKAYRKACFLCHPDMFTDESMKAKANLVFLELESAYTKNDLKMVLEILENLKNGIYDITQKIEANLRQILLNRLEYLKSRRSELISIIKSIKNNREFRDIEAIKDLEEFFRNEKIKLENELNNIKNEQ